MARGASTAPSVQAVRLDGFAQLPLLAVTNDLFAAIVLLDIEPPSLWDCHSPSAPSLLVRTSSGLIIFCAKLGRVVHYLHCVSAASVPQY